MSHECARAGCNVSVSASKLMCAADWALVPPALQRAVYAAWAGGRGAGTPAHRAAILAAIRCVNGEPEPAEADGQ